MGSKCVGVGAFVPSEYGEVRGQALVLILIFHLTGDWVSLSLSLQKPDQEAQDLLESFLLSSLKV